MFSASFKSWSPTNPDDFIIISQKGEEGLKARKQILNNIFSAVKEEQHCPKFGNSGLRNFLANKIHEISELNNAISKIRWSLINSQNNEQSELINLMHSEVMAYKLNSYLKDLKLKAKDTPNSPLLIMNKLSIKLSTIALFSSINAITLTLAQKYFNNSWYSTDLIYKDQTDPDVSLTINYSLLASCSAIALLSTLIIKKLTLQSTEAKYLELNKYFNG